jgi:hypothetical protein
MCDFFVAGLTQRCAHALQDGMTTLRMYDYPASCNCYKVRLLLAQLGVPYERVPVDIFDGGTLTDEYAQMNPARTLIQGVVCGVRVEDIQEPTMQAIRYLDKLIDELARGRAMEKILRK